MCKLCNTDRPEHSSKILSPQVKEFVETVQDYINEIPCTYCIRTYSCNNSTRKYDLDMYILSKLYMSYRNFNSITLRETKRTSTTVLPGIRMVKSYNSTLYKVVVYNSTERVYLGSTKTLEQALSMKIQYCIDNNVSKSLTILQRKLNEITNNN